MTAKRFTMDNEVGMLDVACANIFDNGEFIGTVPLFDAEKFVDLLNELHEENEDLAIKKEDVEYELIHLKENYEELLEKNKKQFMGIGQLIDKYEELLEEINSLRKENMKLKELEG